MLNKQIKQKQGGFTIIEVMIVLAIAGLIMLIVFLAVPALQRSQRNTGRKDDAGRIGTAINDYVSNNNGALPVVASWGTASTGGCATIVNDAGTLDQYNAANNFTCGPSVATAGTANAFDIETGGVTLNAIAAQGMVLDEGATCPQTATSAPTTGTGTPQQVALLYTVEPSGGNWTWDCIQE